MFVCLCVDCASFGEWFKIIPHDRVYAYVQKRIVVETTKIITNKIDKKVPTLIQNGPWYTDRIYGSEFHIVMACDVSMT